MKKKQVSKSKLWMLIFAGMFIVSIVLAVWFAMLMPKERTYEAPSGNIVDTFPLDSSEWLYATTDGTLVKMIGKDEIGDTYNIIKMAKEQYDIEAGTLRKIYKETGSKYLWIITSHLDKDGNNSSYLFQAEYKDGDVKIMTYAPVTGNFDNIFLTEDDGYLYIVDAGHNVAKLSKVDVNNATAGIIQDTYLYDCAMEGKKVKLTAVRMPGGVYSFETDGEYLYILHSAGMIRVATDFEDVTYQSKNSSYKVDSLDTSRYISFGLSGVAASGGAFVEEAETLYVTARDEYLYSMKLSDIDSLKIGDDLKCNTVDDIKFDIIPTENEAVWYEEKEGVGYVMHDSSSKVTKLNFKTGKIDFIFDLEFNISKVIQGETEDDIFYIYGNENKSGESGKAILSYVNVNSRRNETLINVGFYAAMTLVLISAVTFIILANIVRKNKQEYALKVVKQMWKQRRIYLALLPSLILLTMFCYYEAIASIALSFFDYSVENPTMIWNNFDNYKQVFMSKDSAEAFLNLVIFLVFDIVTALVPPLLFAFFLSVMKSERLSNLTRTLLFVSHVVPSIAGMLIWKTGIYGGNGVLNTIIEWFGGEPIAFLGQTEYAKWSILMISFPFIGSYLIFYGGMMNISKSYYEAAELEGIGIWRRLVSIDIPLIFPQLKYVFITTFIHSLQNFQRTYMITGGSFGTKTPIHMMYQNMVNGEYGQASAYATVIFILLFGAAYVNLRKQKQDLED